MRVYIKNPRGVSARKNAVTMKIINRAPPVRMIRGENNVPVQYLCLFLPLLNLVPCIILPALSQPSPPASHP